MASPHIRLKMRKLCWTKHIQVISYKKFKALSRMWTLAIWEKITSLKTWGQQISVAFGIHG